VGSGSEGVTRVNPHFSHGCTSLLRALLHLFLSWSAFPIERLLPPRFLRGEKVAKPDEGGVDAQGDQPRLVRTA